MKATEPAAAPGPGREEVLQELREAREARLLPPLPHEPLSGGLPLTGRGGVLWKFLNHL